MDKNKECKFRSIYFTDVKDYIAEKIDKTAKYIYLLITLQLLFLAAIALLIRSLV